MAKGRPVLRSKTTPTAGVARSADDRAACALVSACPTNGNRSMAKSRTGFVVSLLFMQGTKKVCESLRGNLVFDQGTILVFPVPQPLPPEPPLSPRHPARSGHP